MQVSQVERIDLVMKQSWHTSESEMSDASESSSDIIIIIYSTHSYTALIV